MTESQFKKHLADAQRYFQREDYQQALDLASELIDEAVASNLSKELCDAAEQLAHQAQQALHQQYHNPTNTDPNSDTGNGSGSLRDIDTNEEDSQPDWEVLLDILRDTIVKGDALSAAQQAKDHLSHLHDNPLRPEYEAVADYPDNLTSARKAVKAGKLKDAERYLALLKQAVASEAAMTSLDEDINRLRQDIDLIHDYIARAQQDLTPHLPQTPISAESIKQAQGLIDRAKALIEQHHQPPKWLAEVELLLQSALAQQQQQLSQEFEEAHAAEDAAQAVVERFRNTPIQPVGVTDLADEIERSYLRDFITHLQRAQEAYAQANDTTAKEYAARLAQWISQAIALQSDFKEAAKSSSIPSAILTDLQKRHTEAQGWSDWWRGAALTFLEPAINRAHVDVEYQEQRFRTFRDLDLGFYTPEELRRKRDETLDQDFTVKQKNDLIRRWEQGFRRQAAALLAKYTEGPIEQNDRDGKTLQDEHKNPILVERAKAAVQSGNFAAAEEFYVDGLKRWSVYWELEVLPRLGGGDEVNDPLKARLEIVSQQAEHARQAREFYAAQIESYAAEGQAAWDLAFTAMQQGNIELGAYNYHQAVESYRSAWKALSRRAPELEYMFSGITDRLRQSFSDSLRVSARIYYDRLTSNLREEQISLDIAASIEEIRRIYGEANTILSEAETCSSLAEEFYDLQPRQDWETQWGVPSMVEVATRFMEEARAAHEAEMVWTEIESDLQEPNYRSARQRLNNARRYHRLTRRIEEVAKALDQLILLYQSYETASADGNLDESRRLLTDIIDLSRYTQWARSRLEVLSGDMANYRRAEARYQKALDVRTVSLSLAIGHLNKALEFFPSHIKARELLDDLEIERTNEEEAENKVAVAHVKRDQAASLQDFKTALKLFADAEMLKEGISGEDYTQLEDDIKILNRIFAQKTSAPIKAAEELTNLLKERYSNNRFLVDELSSLNAINARERSFQQLIDGAQTAKAQPEPDWNLVLILATTALGTDANHAQAKALQNEAVLNLRTQIEAGLKLDAGDETFSKAIKAEATLRKELGQHTVQQYADRITLIRAVRNARPYIKPDGTGDFGAAIRLLEPYAEQLTDESLIFYQNLLVAQALRTAKSANDAGAYERAEEELDKVNTLLSNDTEAENEAWKIRYHARLERAKQAFLQGQPVADLLYEYLGEPAAHDLYQNAQAASDQYQILEDMWNPQSPLNQLDMLQTELAALSNAHPTYQPVIKLRNEVILALLAAATRYEATNTDVDLEPDLAEWVEAINIYEMILQIAPGNEQASEGLRRVERVLSGHISSVITEANQIIQNVNLTLDHANRLFITLQQIQNVIHGSAA